jgi:hypothetical protein
MCPSWPQCLQRMATGGSSITRSLTSSYQCRPRRGRLAAFSATGFSACWLFPQLHLILMDTPMREQVRTPQMRNRALRWCFPPELILPNAKVTDSICKTPLFPMLRPSCQHHTEITARAVYHIACQAQPWKKPVPFVNRQGRCSSRPAFLPWPAGTRPVMLDIRTRPSNIPWHGTTSGPALSTGPSAT